MCSHWWYHVTGIVLGSAAAWGFAHAELGATIENREMPTLGGGTHSLLTNAAANVFIFFRPGQEHSRATLRQLAGCEREFAAKPVHWVAVVSDRYARADVLADVRQAGITMPVLIDVGDALYGKLGVFLCPVVGIADREHKLVAYRPFTQVNYIAVIRAQVRHVLGEINRQELEVALHPPSPTRGGDPAVARRRLHLAERQFAAGNQAKALANVEISLAKDPGQAAAHALRGDILAAQGRRAEALQAYERALALDPANARALAGRRASQGEVE